MNLTSLKGCQHGVCAQPLPRLLQDTPLLTRLSVASLYPHVVRQAPHRCIGSAGPVGWPPAPDLTMLHYFLRGIIQCEDYQQSTTTDMLHAL
jgi:hypothetical protein